MLLQENTVFDKRYQLIRLLGRGGFSEVWLAKDSYTKLDIALKVYAPGQGMDSDGLAEFSAELAGVFNLNHTNLLKPTHVDAWEGMPYLIMPFCSHGSIVKCVGKMQEDEIWKLIHDVASGLAYLHKNDIVHQDIKPDNILLDDNGNYVITDFGISTKARSTLRKSAIGGAVSGGTMAYMGPERFSKQPAPTKASDIWSFGAMVYELITGNVPFGELGGGMQKGGADIPYIEANVSDSLKCTIYKMLSNETWERPTAETLVAWSQNPKSIEIDYELLEVQEGVGEKDSARDHTLGRNSTGFSAIESRETRRFDAKSSIPDSGFSLSVESISAPADGVGATEVRVLGVDDFRVNVSRFGGWIHTTNNEDNSFVVICEKNQTGETRSSTIYVKSGGESRSVNVTQHSMPKSPKRRLWIILPILIVASLLLWKFFAKAPEVSKENIETKQEFTIGQYINNCIKDGSIRVDISIVGGKNMTIDESCKLKVSTTCDCVYLEVKGALPENTITGEMVRSKETLNVGHVHDWEEVWRPNSEEVHIDAVIGTLDGKVLVNAYTFKVQPKKVKEEKKPVVKKETKTTMSNPPKVSSIVENDIVEEIDIDEQNEDVIYVVVDKMPEFPGGNSALFNYLSSNIRYPEVARELGVQGRVICQFVVNKDGTISDVEVVRSGGHVSLDKEAVRVIRSMPKWKPGSLKGKTKRVKYTVPVNFKLN